MMLGETRARCVTVLVDSHYQTHLVLSCWPSNWTGLTVWLASGWPRST